MKILTAAEMREVDRLTIERGIPGVILMENAAARTVEFLLETFRPLTGKRVVVICGKGNNGGDGFAIARQLFTRRLCQTLWVVEVFDRDALKGDAAANRRMLDACGCPVLREAPFEAYAADLVIDAILGTGLRGPAEGASLEAIKLVNERFPQATKVAVDLPSGLPSDGTELLGAYLRADHTVTFTAAKLIQVLAPIYEKAGRLTITEIGTPHDLCEGNREYRMRLSVRDNFRHLFGLRAQDSNKGMYGHVLVVGGSYGKSGAPTMAATAAYRAGAGLVTVAIPKSALNIVAAYQPELMTEALEETEEGRLSVAQLPRIADLLKKMTVLALGPGLGTADVTVQLVRRLYAEADVPAVIDADALNALAGELPATDKIRILTPHPGEMARLCGKSTKDVQANRLAVAQELASKSGAAIVLKGDRTIIAFPEGETWVNPTGSPAMATGGTGDILTGLIAGMVAQHPGEWKRAVVAAVWLHGRCGEFAAQKLGVESTLATDLFRELPNAINELRPVI